MRVVLSWHLAPAPGKYEAGSQPHPDLLAHKPRLNGGIFAPSTLDMPPSLQICSFPPKISSLIRSCLAMQGNSLCLCSFTVTDKETGVLC